MNNKYVKHFRCRHCGTWVKKKEALYNKNKQPTCPECGRRLKQKRNGQRFHFHQLIDIIPKYEAWVKL